MKTFDGALYGLSLFFIFQCRGFIFLGRFWKNGWVLFSKFLVTGKAKLEIIGCSYEETRNVFQLKKAWVSFVFGVKNAQTNVHSWCIHFHTRWTQLMKFCISNSITTVPFGRATSIRHSPFSPTTFIEIAVYNSTALSYSHILIHIKIFSHAPSTYIRSHSILLAKNQSKKEELVKMRCIATFWQSPKG